MLANLVWLVIGFILLIKGADFFVEGASSIAEKFNIPQIVIGLTIVAFGTSAPEAAISITAAMAGNSGITIGNVVGSNILNILLILGITAVVTVVPVAKNTLKYEMPFVTFITILLLVLGVMGSDISRIDGIIFWLIFLFFLYYLYRLSKSGESSPKGSVNVSKESSMPRMIIITLIGLVFIVWGSDRTVNAATGIAQAIGISDRIIGLTIVAFGTSLPELLTSVTAAFKGKPDIAIGNIVGSNIFNILFVIGTVALIHPVDFSSGFIIDTGVAIAASALLLILCAIKKKLTRPAGIILLLSYMVYFTYLIMA